MLYDPMKDYDEVGRTLIKTSQHLKEHGHCKGSLGTIEGNVCLYGALNMIIYGIPNRHELPGSVFNEKKNENDLWKECSNAILNECADLMRVTSAVDWNDHPDTTPEMVINLLEGIASKHKITV